MNKIFLAVYLNDSNCTSEFIDIMLPHFDKLISLGVNMCVMIQPKYYNIVKVALIEHESEILVKLYTAELDHANTLDIAKYLIKSTGNRPYDYIFSVNVDALTHDNMTETLPDKLKALDGNTITCAITETGTFFGGKLSSVASSTEPNSKQKIKMYKPKSLVKNNLHSFISQLKSKK